MKLEDKVNLAIAFLNKDKNIEKDNIFTFDNIKLVDTLYLHKNIFCTEKITNIQISNPHPTFSFIPKLGFSFRIQQEYLDKLNYQESYFCYYIASIINDSITLKHNLIQLLINEYYENLENAKKEVINLEQEINKLVKLQ